jgi:hypothetical protein
MSATKTAPLYSWRARSASTRLVYIRDNRKADLEVLNLRGPLGFDLEWRPNVIKGQVDNRVALVQLSDKNTILLIQVSAMAGFPGKLKKLLGNSDIVKAGVGVQYDCKKLYADWKVTVRNCVDLSLLARCVDNARWKGRYTDPIGLARLVETYEGYSLAKGKKAQRSNWEAQLSKIQQDYAANDAHSAFTIYSKFAKMAQTMAATPKPIYYSFDAINGLLCKPSGAPWSPVNPDYNPSLLPPNSTLTTNKARVKTAAPVTISKPSLLTPSRLELNCCRSKIINASAGRYSSSASGRRRFESLSRAGHHSSAPPMFDRDHRDHRKPEITSRGSYSSSTSSTFVPGRHMLGIPNGRVNYNPPPSRRLDSILSRGHRASMNEPQPLRLANSYERQQCRSGDRGGSGAYWKGPSS